MVLIIDGNYILNRNVFSLNSAGVLFGSLQDSLEQSLIAIKKMYTFSDIYFVSDSAINWRKEIYQDYKVKNKKKDENIDWDFVKAAYKEFKEDLPRNVKLRERNRVEGDDWFHTLTKRHNLRGESCLMVTNDSDIKQELHTGDDYINIIINENSLSNKMFVPHGYKTWLYNYRKRIGAPSLENFDEMHKWDMIKFIKKLAETRNVEEVNIKESLFKKIVSGDTGDNIKSIWTRIGPKTVDVIYDKYLEYFDEEPDMSEVCIDRICDIVIEVKKLQDSDYELLNENLKFNNKLVNFREIPPDIIELMNI